METKQKNCYRLTFKDLQDKIPEIEGDIVEVSVDDKTNELVVDTVIANYEDEKVLVHKSLVTTTKEIYIAKDKITGLTAEAPTQEEAIKRLDEQRSKPDTKDEAAKVQNK